MELEEAAAPGTGFPPTDWERRGRFFATFSSFTFFVCFAELLRRETGGGGARNEARLTRIFRGSGSGTASFGRGPYLFEGRGCALSGPALRQARHWEQLVHEGLPLHFPCRHLTHRAHRAQPPLQPICTPGGRFFGSYPGFAFCCF